METHIKQKKRKMTAREEQDHFAAFFQFSQEAGIILSPSLTIIAYNLSAEKIFSWQRKTVLGKNFFSVCAEKNISLSLSEGFSKILAGSVPEKIKTTIGQNEILWTLAPSLAQGKQVNGIVLLGSVSSALQLGKTILPLGLNEASNVDEDLAKLSVALTGQPAHNSQSALESAKNIYQYMENIIAIIPNSIYWMNTQGVYLGCNDSMAKLLRLKSREEFVGKTYEDLYDEKSASFYKKADKEVMSTGIAQTLEEPLYNPDGSCSIYLSSKVPLRSIDGKIVGMLGISVDITERKKMEEQLKQALENLKIADQFRAKFLSMLTHEIVGHVANIPSMIGLIKDKLNQPGSAWQDLLEYLDWIEQSATTSIDHIKLVRKYLDLEREGVTSRLAQCNISALLKKIIADEAVPNCLKVKLDCRLPQLVLIDDKHATTVLKTLIHNAVRFTREGTIHITAKPAPGHKGMAELSVADTGKGMSDLQVQGMFGMLSAEESKTDLFASYRNPALNLSIAKKLMELIGGKLEIATELNKGTTVTTILPYQALKVVPFTLAQRQGNFSVGPRNIGAQQNPKYRVLLVEDEPITLQIYKKMLEKAGCQVDTAASGTEAISAGVANHYDCLFLDISLPDMTGIEAKQLIWEKTGKDTPAIAVTSHASPEDELRFLGTGFLALLAKPVRQEDFIECLKSLDRALRDMENDPD